MQYRTLPPGGEKIGIVGMGSAVELGVNYFDLAAGHATCFPTYGKALADCRKNVYLQIHVEQSARMREIADYFA